MIISCKRIDNFIFPRTVPLGIKLTVPDHPALGIFGPVGNSRLHIYRLCNRDGASAQIKRVVIAAVQQSLKRLFKRQLFGFERINIGGQIIGFAKHQRRIVGHHKPPLNLHRSAERQTTGNVKGALGHQQLTPVCRLISSDKCIVIIGLIVPKSAVIAHIHHIDHFAVKQAGDILDFKVVNPHNAAASTG